jgi:hypothetical protein
MVPKELRALYYFYLVHQSGHGLSVDHLWHDRELMIYVSSVFWSGRTSLFDCGQMETRAIQSILKDLGV